MKKIEKAMTGRERLLTVFKGGIPDKIPWAPILNDYFLSSLPPDMRTDDPVDGCKILGADVADRWVTSFKGYFINPIFGEDAIDPIGLKKSNIKLSEVDKKDGSYYVYETPVGTINCRLIENKIAGSTKFIYKKWINNMDDMLVYQYICEAKEIHASYDKTKKRMDYIGDDGIAMLMIPPTPLLQLIQFDLGLAKLNYFLTDHPKKMEKLLGIMTDKAIEACNIAAASPAKVGIIAENSGTLLVSPKQFNKYCVPVLTEYAKIFKQHGKHLILHACGHMKEFLGEIAKIDGLTGIDSLNEPPLGNVELQYARNILRDDMTIMGGIDPLQFLNSSPKELEKMVIDVINKVRPGKHYILMPCDSTPSGVPVENFHTVNQTIDKYGKWRN